MLAQGKEDVHAAIKNLDKGIVPSSVSAKSVPDYLTGAVLELLRHYAC